MRKTVTVTLKPVMEKCPHCSSVMKRDYKNRRTVLWPNRTIILDLQILRCHHGVCPRYKQPYRPETEWLVALPGTKFGWPICETILQRHLSGASNLAIHRELATCGIACSPRSIPDILHRILCVYEHGDGPWPPTVAKQLRDQRRVYLNVLSLANRVVVRDVLSTVVLGSSDSPIDLFRSLINRLPLRVAAIYCSSKALCELLDRVWTIPTQVAADGRPVGTF